MINNNNILSLQYCYNNNDPNIYKIFHVIDCLFDNQKIYNLNFLNLNN